MPIVWQHEREEGFHSISFGCNSNKSGWTLTSHPSEAEVSRQWPTEDHLMEFCRSTSKTHESDRLAWNAFGTNRCQRRFLQLLTQKWTCTGWGPAQCVFGAEHELTATSIQQFQTSGTEWKDKGVGQLGLHKLSVTVDDVLICKKKKEQPGSLFAANALGELIKETRRKLQSVESEVVDVWERRKTSCCPCQTCQAVLSAGTMQGQQAEVFFRRRKAQQRRGKRQRNTAET